MVVDGPDAGRTTTSDNLGVYQLTGLEQAEFSVSVSADGYSTVSDSVVLTSNITLDFELQPRLTSLTFISAETQTPVVGASVTIGGETYTTDDSGSVSVENPLLNTPLVVSSPHFMERRTVFRLLSETTFPLWPKTSPIGLTEQFTREIIYTWAFGGDSKPLTRVMGNRVSIVLDPELRSDSQVMDSIRSAVDRITEATDGTVVYELMKACAGGDVCYGVSLSSDGTCGVDATFENWYLTGGTIRCNRSAIRRPGTALHEIGHTFGLQHTSGNNDVMCGPIGGRGGQCGDPGDETEFSARERLVMKLTLQRSPGNVFPDNDQ